MKISPPTFFGRPFVRTWWTKTHLLEWTCYSLRHRDGSLKCFSKGAKGVEPLVFTFCFMDFKGKDTQLGGNAWFSLEQITLFCNDVGSIPLDPDLWSQVGGGARKTNKDYTAGTLPELVDIIIEEKARLRSMRWMRNCQLNWVSEIFFVGQMLIWTVNMYSM